MKNIRQIEGWRAEEIAKVFLLNSGLVTLVPEYNDQFDFLAISNQAPEKKIAVEIKATKHSKKEIEKISNKIKSRFVKTGLPVLLMYINSDKEDGYFEIVTENASERQELQPLQLQTFEQKLDALIK